MTYWIVVKSQILNTDKNLDMCFREICFVYTLELQVVKSSSKRCTWRNQHVNILQNINTYPRNMLGRITSFDSRLESFKYFGCFELYLLL